LFFALISFTVNGQNSDTKKADKLFENLAYTDAIEAYSKLIEKGKGGPYVYTQLAKSYTILNDTKQAESFYKRAAKIKDASPEVLYGYAQSLKANGKASDYEKWMKKFAQSSPSDPRAKLFSSNPTYLGSLLDKEPAFTVQNADKLNSNLADFGAFVKDNVLYFASARNTLRKNHNLNGEPFLDLYSATLDGSSLGSPEILNGDVNTKYHESSVAISPDGNRMYFDRNDYFEGDLDKSNEGVNQINMYTAEKVGGNWENIESVPFNDDNYSTGHPALSPDGKTLYFTSDKPGGKGGSDIYMVSVNDDGSFGEPSLLPGAVNTSETEAFPFMADDGTLYFSSNGHLGLGGLDAFSAFAKAGSFSKGSDDIYILGQVPPCDVDVAFTVEDEAGVAIPQALVEIVNNTEDTTDSDTATTTGKYLFSSKCNRDYTVTASADGYKSKTRTLAVGKAGVQNVITLEAIEPPVITKTEVVLNPIYFDFDKWNIRPDAAAELDRLVFAMQNNPTMVISGESHTDSRGSDSYNQSLSQKRAESMRDYVISRGISSSRISGVGRGESQLSVNCGSNCTEDEHQLNRRGVFRIISR